MKAPERVSADEFVRAYIKDKLRHVPINGVLSCVSCRTALRDVPVSLSLHAAELKERCTGPGALLVVKISFCPKCEGEPAKTGCLHVEGLL